MKLAISNIAWTNEEEPEIAALLQSMGVKYVEIAPTKLWGEPLSATDEQIEEYIQFWAKYDIQIVAFQSMLFSHPDYKLFESLELRDLTKNYLQSFTGLAGRMGVSRMVFGSPKNRQRNGLDYDAAEVIAEGFFAEIGDVAESNGVVFCIEPNAPQYNCDFVMNAQEGRRLVTRVNKPGFGLHLDIACMALAGDNIEASIIDNAAHLKHFHISSPMLDKVVQRDDIDHDTAARALKEIGYDGYVSIEMRPGEMGENTERVRNAVAMAQEVYGV